MSSEYFPEILRYFITKSQRALSRASTEIPGWMRDKVCRWICDICEESRYRIETLELSIEILNEFLSNSDTTPHTIQLVAVVSLMLAVKYHEKTTLTLIQAAACCMNKYSISNIQITEFFILQKLGWKVDIPTASEISRALLLATGIPNDLTKIFERADAFAATCYLDFKLFKFTSLEIAIISTVCALEQFNQLSFRNQWLNSLVNRVSLDIMRLNECKRLLVEKLLLITPVNDRNKIECLTREEISSLVHQNLIIKGN